VAVLTAFPDESEIVRVEAVVAPDRLYLSVAASVPSNEMLLPSADTFLPISEAEVKFDAVV
jgi:hypothetical protein